jgi:hypothetical protein
MLSYDIEDQRNIVVATCVLHNFIRIHDREDEGFKWDESNAGETHRSAQENMENIQDESNSSPKRTLSGLAMISIENEYFDKLNYDDLIEKFASKHARRSNFLGVGLC